jgi:hypothetical protein
LSGIRVIRKIQNKPAMSARPTTAQVTSHFQLEPAESLFDSNINHQIAALGYHSPPASVSEFE